MRAFLAPLTLLLACDAGGSVSGDGWKLHLTPLVPEGQTAFEADAELTLRVERDGDVDLVPLGAAADSTWELPDQDALAGTRLGMLLTDPGGGVDPLDYADLRAWGLTPPITQADGSRDLPILVGRYGEPGALGELGVAQRSFGAAACVLSSGDVMLFGGTAAVFEVGSPAWGHILRMSRADDDLAFKKIDDMPTWPQTDANRVGATATPVVIDGQELVLVAGGRRAWIPTTQPAPQAFLWDPDAGQMVWSSPLRRDRSQHAAVRIPGTPGEDEAAGDVLLLGGFSDQPAPAALTFEWFRHATRAFEDGGEALGVGSVGFGWAVLNDSVLVCGGGVGVPAQVGVIAAQAGCRRIGFDGAARTATDINPLGVATPNRMWHAMATLGDGTVLLTGGVNQSIPDTGTAPALDTAFLYDPDRREWTSVGTLRHARAMHAMLPLPDGRVLILGGTTAAFGTAPEEVGAAVDIPEVYDPATGTFTELPANDAAAGALPALAVADGYGGFMVAGVQPGSSGGVRFGMISLGP